MYLYIINFLIIKILICYYDSNRFHSDPPCFRQFWPQDVSVKKHAEVNDYDIMMQGAMHNFVNFKFPTSTAAQSTASGLGLRPHHIRDPSPRGAIISHNHLHTRFSCAFYNSQTIVMCQYTSQPICI